MPLEPGSHFGTDGRFRIERLAGTGGMGAVYRAFDQQSGRVVALKLLHSEPSGAHAQERFLREARLLAELEHPGIVAHYDHGISDDGVHFLAMEWLEGEDLATLLRSRLLTVRAAFRLLERVAGALAVAHAHGVVHRDIKPGNLFLVGGDLEQPRLLDFGVARTQATASLTKTGVLVGTPNYMAPEQARGEPHISPAADVFSLGCVLYECLTGKPPFHAEHLVAILAGIVLDEPRPIRRPMPPAHQALLMSMLAKQRDMRPANAQALVDTLRSLGEPPEDDSASYEGATIIQSAARSGDQGLLCVVMAAARSTVDAARTGGSADTEQHRRELIEAMAPFAVPVEFLLDGSLVVVLHGSGHALDQAVQAAHAALIVADRWPEARVALATGRGSLKSRAPVGEVAQDAAALLKRWTPAVDGSAGGRSRILLDELSARLLERRFLLGKTGEDTFLLGVHDDSARPLLGRPTPCVGREAELTVLAAQLTACIDESEVRTLLVTAPAGVGKSRLLDEFLRRSAAQDEPVTRLLGSGSPMSSGAPGHVLRSLLRRLCGETQPELLRRRLEARLGGTMGAQAAGTAEFLAELCGATGSEPPSEALRAARNDPKLMREQFQRALAELLAAESSAQALLIVLEDLHWADALSVALLEGALRIVKSAPICVLALGRPEVRQLFPTLFTGHASQGIALHSLPRRASERLIQHVLAPLGHDGPALRALAARLHELSAGNPLLLEELLRAVVEGKTPESSETAIAIIQARYERLTPAARQVIRAASVFGQGFTRSGVEALLVEVTLAEPLHVLVAAEVIAERSEGRRAAGEETYGFRHALLREAAYALWTDDDRARAHRLAGEHLLAAADYEPAEIAEHFNRGGDLGRAAIFYEEAAERALACHDIEGALAKSGRALECGADGERRGRMLGVQCMAHFWNNAAGPSLARGEAALLLLPMHTRRWCEVIVALMFMVHSGAPEPAAMKPGELVEIVLTTPATAATRPLLAETVGWLCTIGVMGADEALADAMYARLLELGREGEGDNLVQTWVNWGAADYIYYRQPAPWTAYLIGQRGLQDFLQIGDRPKSLLMRTALGLQMFDLGERGAGEALLRAAWIEAREGREMLVRGVTAAWIAAIFNRTLQADDGERMTLAHAVARELLAEVGDSHLSHGFGRLVRAKIHSVEGRADEALADAEQAFVLLSPVLPAQRLASAGRLRLLVQHGQVERAAALARDELDHLYERGGTGAFELPARTACIHALLAGGDVERARAELWIAIQRLPVRLADMPGFVQRAMYLDNNVDCLQLRELSRALLGVDELAGLARPA